MYLFRYNKTFRNASKFFTLICIYNSNIKKILLILILLNNIYIKKKINLNSNANTNVRNLKNILYDSF